MTAHARTDIRSPATPPDRGRARELFPFLQQPEGRIHFAGVWVGGIPGSVHGAVLSAHSVVRNIQAG
jgi:monoamine oxidase